MFLAYGSTMLRIKEIIMKVIESNDFQAMNNGSYYTIVGAGGDIMEWVNGYSEIMSDKGIGTPTQWYTFKGKELNDYYDLQGDNKFDDSLVFLTFPLDGLHIGKLAMYRITMRDRWFDDMIANSTGAY